MTLTLTQTNQSTYKLNDVELTLEDFCLLLEMNGFEVPRDLPYGTFFRKAMESLSRLDADEFFEILDAFNKATPQQKAFWQQMVTSRKLATTFSTPN